MVKQIPIVLAVALLLAGALIQGHMSERWTTFPELEVYAQELEKVPLDVGEWRGEDGPKMDARMKEVAGAVGAISRKFSNTTLNETVTMDLVSGRPRDMFFHTPDRCYPAAGWESPGKQTSIEIDGVEGNFFTNTYTKVEPSGMQNLRVYWAWSNDGLWTAPDDFKWKYGGNPSLYKLYVMVPVNNSEQSAEHNAATEFIRVLVPELKKTLFKQASAPAAPNAVPKSATNPATEAAPGPAATVPTPDQPAEDKS